MEERTRFLKACGCESPWNRCLDLYFVFHAFGLDTLLIGNDMESRDNEAEGCRLTCLGDKVLPALPPVSA